MIDTKPISSAFTAELFSAFDVDHSGYLTAAELRHVMSTFHLQVDDVEMSEMVKMFDETGTSRIYYPQFKDIISKLGYNICEEQKGVGLSGTDGNGLKSPISIPEKEEKDNISLDGLPERLKEALTVFDTTGTGVVNLEHIKEAGRQVNSWSDHSLPTSNLGLGTLLTHVSHIALIVSDVGRSAKFYCEVMGFTQIGRPNFDEHGAWFRMGAVQLHLIKGRPVVHNGDNLVVGHISLEANNIKQVAEVLKRMKVPFRQNVSVPQGVDAGVIGTNKSNDTSQILTQFFVPDPDGYWLEICNCSEFEKTTEEDLSEEVATELQQVLKTWSWEAKDRVEKRRESCNKSKRTNVRDVAKEIGCMSVKEVDEELLKVFEERRSVYGDISQGESRESLEEKLKLAGNSATKANEMMGIIAMRRGKQLLQPPGFYEDGEEYFLPPRVFMGI